MKAPFTDRLQDGQIAEALIAEWLRSACSYHVLPVYEKEIANGKGPRLFTTRGELVAPDLFAMRGASTKWVEAKHKSVWSWRGVGGFWEDGIDLPHYRDYVQVAEQTEWPVWLLFLHTNDIPSIGDRQRWPNCPDRCPTGLFGGDILTLRHTARIDETPRYEHPHGMAYWKYSDLRLLVTLDQFRRGLPA